MENNPESKFTLSNYLFLTFSGGLGGFFVLELLSKCSKQQQQQRDKTHIHYV